MADVRDDEELQNWAAEIASDEAGRVRDFGVTPGRIADRNDLIEILEPTGKEHTEADWLAHLPPLDVAVQQFCVMTFLGSIHHTVFGDYDYLLPSQIPNSTNI